MEKSDYGTFYDVTKSIYKVKVGDFVFYFSTKTRMEKFNKTYKDYVEKRNLRTKHLSLFKVDLTTYYLLKYYVDMENINFYFTYKDKQYTINNLEVISSII